MEVITDRFRVLDTQTSGKEPQLLSEDGMCILKSLKKPELVFYSYLASLHCGHISHCIRQHIPQYLGEVSLSSFPKIIYNDEDVQNKYEFMTHLVRRFNQRKTGSKFIALRNQTYGYRRANVMDIKLGYSKPKDKQSSCSKYKFKLNGCHMYFQEGELNNCIFLSKYHMKSVVSDQDIMEHFGLYFYDGKRIRTTLLKEIIERVMEITLCFKSLRGWKFYSTSICFFYDCDSPRWSVKLIDFQRCEQCAHDFFDEQTCIGLENVIYFLRLVVENSEQLAQSAQLKRQYYNKERILVVPQSKKLQYLNTFSLSSSRETSEGQV